MNFLDPESLSFFQWWPFVFVCVLAVFFLCRAIDMYYPEQLLQIICPTLGIFS
jgi:hypothetical protein